MYLIYNICNKVDSIANFIKYSKCQRILVFHRFGEVPCIEFDAYFVQLDGSSSSVHHELNLRNIKKSHIFISHQTYTQNMLKN